MTELATELQRLRSDFGRSIRWVARRSEELHPADRQLRISHTYLRQIEAGVRTRPSPPKLQTLAEIYGVDYQRLLSLAGYLEKATSGKEGESLSEALYRRLQAEGIRPEYFVHALLDLSSDSLSIVYRLITTLSIQGRGKQRRRQLNVAAGGIEGSC